VWRLLLKLLEFLEEHWSDPDEGLWEVRGPRRHFVHSKIMCWVAFDRAVKLADETGMAGPVERWRELRDIVHTDVCSRGLDKKRGVLTQYYGGAALDASTLFAIKSGFFAPDDQRAVATVEAIAHELNHEGYILRYSTPSDDADTDAVDGLSGSEGAFLACSYWLCDALIALGRLDEARARFDRLRGLANDVGLISEEWDPLAGRQLGNTPQAFTDVALANTAFLLARAEGTGVTGMTADATADAAADAAARTRTGTRKEG
jgi:GH15 family glucan-1,4-alpha-glucosidase